jgi:uncharacterized protein YjbI with pentapeptide repeats
MTNKESFRGTKSMANEEHLNILQQGVEAWNQWRRDNPKIIPNLSFSDLGKTNLVFANLSGADLSRADLSKVNLSNTNLSDTKLSDANLSFSDLSGANLSGAYLIYANLSEANLFYANLSKANLSKANLSEADLRRADLSDADLSDADLKAARLIKARLDRANISGTLLWETQRARWSIKGIICDYVYWDEDAKEKTDYPVGNFERLYAEQTKIRLLYKDGISPLEVATLPALIQHLEDVHRGCRLSLLTIKSDSGGAIVELAVEEDESSSEQLQKKLPSKQAQIQEKIAEEDSKKWKTTIEQVQSDAQETAQRLGQVIRENEKLQNQMEGLQWAYREMLNKGTGNTYVAYNISGQAGAVGHGSQAEGNTFTSTPAKKTEDE